MRIRATIAALSLLATTAGARADVVTDEPPSTPPPECPDGMSVGEDPHGGWRCYFGVACTDDSQCGVGRCEDHAVCVVEEHGARAVTESSAGTCGPDDTCERGRCRRGRWCVISRERLLDHRRSTFRCGCSPAPDAPAWPAVVTAAGGVMALLRARRRQRRRAVSAQQRSGRRPRPRTGP